MYDKHLDGFLMAADCGSFSQAAQRLYISTNALIKQINLLESRLGITLFVRSRQGIELTDAGRSIYRDAKRIIGISEQAVRAAKDIERLSGRSIRIGTSQLRPCKTLVDVWSTVSRRYQDISLSVVPFNDESLLAVLDALGEGIDVIAGIYPSTLWNNRCQALHLADLPLCCAMARNHPLAYKRRLTFDDLDGQTLIMIRRGDTSYIDELRDEIETNHPGIRIHSVPSYGTDVFNQVEALGGLMVSVQIWSELHPSLVTVPCEWRYTVPYGIVYPLKPAPIVERFVEAMRTAGPLFHND
ncbi:LysR family transcriptional regulator [Bifidobacterium eulemuris]|uniref:Transcriptional regulator n=1 Tax=Bifidobacterium eulemuris TaxID=1765219 RepID=A0A261GD95_9BIFI|nr:LysR family transcriptional regulator [Bifidobacterium eulemuris]OZG69419.1 transcriptional regulator [Bifidobacterium eulemuris]QOL31102.1 LysR family transcriptional regulator [Bifidobacterium eulemuris]